MWNVEKHRLIGVYSLEVILLLLLLSNLLALHHEKCCNKEVDKIFACQVIRTEVLVTCVCTVK